MTGGKCRCGTPETVAWAPVFAFADESEYGWKGWSGYCGLCGGYLRSTNERDDPPGRLLSTYTRALRAQ